MKIKVIFLSSVVVSTVLFLPDVSLARDPDKFYSAGWSRTMTLNNIDMFTSSDFTGRDVGDISVAEAYDPTYGKGMVRVRGFSQNSNVHDYYEIKKDLYNSTVIVGVNKMALGTMDDTTSHAMYFNVNNTNPGEVDSAKQSSPVWTSAVYDILSVAGVPTNTVEAMVNYLYDQTSPGITVDTSSAYRRIVTQSAGDYSDYFPTSKTDLGISNPQENPDQLVSGQYKGMEALFYYDLPSRNQNYRMKSTMSITYTVKRYQSSTGFTDHWNPIANASVFYTVNQ